MLSWQSFDRKIVNSKLYLITIQYHYHLLIIFCKIFPLILSQVAKRIFCVQEASTASERDFSASGYTIWDRRNALLPRKVNMMMILQQFDKNIERLNKFK